MPLLIATSSLNCSSGDCLFLFLRTWKIILLLHTFIRRQSAEIILQSQITAARRQVLGISGKLNNLFELYGELKSLYCACSVPVKILKMQHPSSNSCKHWSAIWRTSLAKKLKLISEPQWEMVGWVILASDGHREETWQNTKFWCFGYCSSKTKIWKVPTDTLNHASQHCYAL